MTYHIVTTILTPAAATPPGKAYDLVTVQMAKDELNIGAEDASKDTTLLRYINQVSTAIAQYCNRTFQTETVKDEIFWGMETFPYQVASGAEKMQLSRWPVQSVTSVSVHDVADALLVAGTDYTLDGARGMLIRRSDMTSFPILWTAAPTTVVYVAGFAEVPADIVDAALRYITMRLASRGRDPLLRSLEQPGLGTETYWVGGPPRSGSLPQEIAALCENYRVPVVV